VERKYLELRLLENRSITGGSEMNNHCNREKNQIQKKKGKKFDWLRKEHGTFTNRTWRFSRHCPQFTVMWCDSFTIIPVSPLWTTIHTAGFLLLIIHLNMFSLSKFKFGFRFSIFIFNTKNYFKNILIYVVVKTQHIHILFH